MIHEFNSNLSNPTKNYNKTGWIGTRVTWTITLDNDLAPTNTRASWSPNPVLGYLGAPLCVSSNHLKTHITSLIASRVYNAVRSFV